ncbi:hypothetical protein E2C01_075199 [Portunus trituberculatus]|uniref:Uncharacterized protein n=1 Tax=Portunus trituberculatus TaxID=210409 RepID=A0A5B7IF81_PORTR|nr:hypothetical protein [Portunus trituberculatus]
MAPLYHVDFKGKFTALPESVLLVDLNGSNYRFGRLLLEWKMGKELQ